MNVTMARIKVKIKLAEMPQAGKVGLLVALLLVEPVLPLLLPHQAKTLQDADV